MMNKKIKVRKTEKYGKGVFAVKNIQKGELVADWTGGKIYIAKKCSDLPKKVADHAIQFAEYKWIDTKTNARYFNHSCIPNCGFKGKFKLVTMREVDKGEELTFDYEMSEDSDWKMKCKCANENCRKIIGAFGNMPQKTKEKYARYISRWLRKKYSLV